MHCGFLGKKKNTIFSGILWCQELSALYVAKRHYFYVTAKWRFEENSFWTRKTTKHRTVLK